MQSLNLLFFLLLQQNVRTPCKTRPAPQCVRVDQQQPPAVRRSATRAKRLECDPAGGEVTPQRDQLQGEVSLARMLSRHLNQ